MMIVLCRSCGIKKPFDDFYESYKIVCKDCVKMRVRERYFLKINEIKAYEYKRARNPIRKAKQKIYRAKWKENNKERVKENSRIYRKRIRKLGILEFSPETKKKRHAYSAERYRTNIKHKLCVSMRNRLYMAIKDNQKTGSAVRDLGCDISFLKTYLEGKFKEGMNWNNWGNTGWHIDHIKPLISFDLGNREELLKAVHYTNLQPLWAIENYTKGIK